MKPHRATSSSICHNHCPFDISLVVCIFQSEIFDFAETYMGSFKCEKNMCRAFQV